MCMRKSEHGRGRALAGRATAGGRATTRGRAAAGGATGGRAPPAGRATARVAPTIHDCDEPGHPCIVGAGLAPPLPPGVALPCPAPTPPHPPPPGPGHLFRQAWPLVPPFLFSLPRSLLPFSSPAH